MYCKHILVNLSLILLLANCTSYDFARRIVQQGNLLSSTKIERLKVGMSKENAAIIIGTSALSPLFNNNRWDYAYTWQKGNGTLTQRHLVLYFAHDAIIRIEKS